MLRDIDPHMEGQISFDEFLGLLWKKDSEGGALGESPDPKVMEFIRILDEYRIKCEEDGNYLEAGRACKQLETLRRQEEKRQSKAVKARQITERQDVQIAHNMQYAEFNAAWDRYLEEYDKMAQMYIQQMTERHAVMLREYQEGLHKELVKRPPKYSKELLDWRRRQNMLARCDKGVSGAGWGAGVGVLGGGRGGVWRWQCGNGGVLEWWGPDSCGRCST